MIDKEHMILKRIDRQSKAYTQVEMPMLPYHVFPGILKWELGNDNMFENCALDHVWVLSGETKWSRTLWTQKLPGDNSLHTHLLCSAGGQWGQQVPDSHSPRYPKAHNHHAKHVTYRALPQLQIKEEPCLTSTIKSCIHWTDTNATLEIITATEVITINTTRLL